MCPPWHCSYFEEDFVNQINYTTLIRTSSSWDELGFISKKSRNLKEHLLYNNYKVSKTVIALVAKEDERPISKKYPKCRA